MAENRRGTVHTIVVDNAKAEKPLVYDQEVLVKMLSPTELEVLNTINAVRESPNKFADRMETYRQYYDDEDKFKIPGEPIVKTKEGRAGLDECIAHLRTLPDGELAPLQLYKGLIYSARDHLVDQFISQDMPVGHQGTDSSDHMIRCNRYGKWGHMCGECINYGDRDPFAIICYFLIDDGKPQRPHRQQLLNPKIQCTGIAAGAHKRCGSNCVIVLTDSFTEDKEMETDWVRDPVVEKGYKKCVKKAFFKDNYHIHTSSVVHEGKNPNKKPSKCALM